MLSSGRNHIMEYLMILEYRSCGKSLEVKFDFYDAIQYRSLPIGLQKILWERIIWDIITTSWTSFIFLNRVWWQRIDPWCQPLLMHLICLGGLMPIWESFWWTGNRSTCRPLELQIYNFLALMLQMHTLDLCMWANIFQFCACKYEDLPWIQATVLYSRFFANFCSIYTVFFLYAVYGFLLGDRLIFSLYYMWN